MNEKELKKGKLGNEGKSLEIHKLGSPPWVDIHKVIDVEETIEEGDLKEITLNYMRKNGWENVRGHTWRQWDMK